MKLFNLVEIKILTKKHHIKQELKERGYFHAIRLCKGLHGWDVSKSADYVKKIRGY